jgi:cobalt-zinc-cadmium efflux system membrane fusion protein
MVPFANCKLFNCFLQVAEMTTRTVMKNQAATGQAQKYFSSEAVSDKYELLIRYEPIHIGEPAHLTLFVSEYATNKPIDKAELKITAQEDSKLVFTAKQTGEGTYTIETTFPEKKNYSLAVSINSQLRC